MADGEQQELWHDTLDDALRATVEAVGIKKIAAELWPEKPIEDARILLRHCVDPDRNEKLSLSQISLIIERGRQADCHTAMHYLARRCGYTEPHPVNPESERDRLLREVRAIGADLQGRLRELERYS